MNSRYKLMVAALCVLGVGAIIATFALIPRVSDMDSYQQTKNGRALRSILQNRIQPANSYDEVRAMLGEGRIESITEDHLYLEWQRTGEMARNTYRAGDFIVHYDVDTGCSASLSFRDGQLIHFDRRNFNDVGGVITGGISR